MSLTAGTRLGPYEILAPIGAGGMGEVWKARDTRLNRDVAIKVSHEQFSERFEREARAIAALNHPNICQLYDVGPNYLVMEFVEGTEPKGPLALDEALRIARQIADALEAAHDKGIVHRDLKPANIKIKADGTVKVLDFGLAKMPDMPAEAAGTITMGISQAGMIVGTAAYMSPEQASGKPVDKRTDIWAFGVVLYEMLTGKRLFGGETISHTLAAVLKDEPDLARVPAKVRRLLAKCLEKDPKKRLRDITGVELLLEDRSRAQIRKQSGLSWAMAVALAIALAGVSWIAWRPTRPVGHPLLRLSVDLGPDAVAGERTTAIISPDGMRIVYAVRGPEGKERLATRLLDQSRAAPLAGTENGEDPFFSPDSQWVGFFADGKLKKISVEGGAPINLCDAPLFRGASWGTSGNIVLSLPGGLWRVSASGGTPQRLTNLERAELIHAWPQILPGDQAVLFTASPSIIAYENASVQVVSLKTGQKKVLLQNAYFGRYLPTNGSAGHLLYAHEGTLFALAFDPTRLEVRGQPVPLLQDVASDPNFGAGQFDFSRDGTFVYRLGTVQNQSWPVMWLDSSGNTQPLLTKPNFYTSPRFSPDGRLLALAVGAGSGTGREVLIYDWQRDTLSRLVTSGNFYPIWSADGKHIVFRSPTSGSTLVWMRADGSGQAQSLLVSKQLVLPRSMSPDGRRLLYRATDPDTKFDLFTLPLDVTDPDRPKPGMPELFLKTPFNEDDPAFSPDGSWVAYSSDESGRREVYVRPFPGPGNKWQVSIDGGRLPIWARAGRQIYFETLDNRIMVAEYSIEGGNFATAKPRRWTETQIRDLGNVANMDIAPDGKRFAVFPRASPPAEGASSLHVMFLLNFFDEVRRRAKP